MGPISSITQHVDSNRQRQDSDLEALVTSLFAQVRDLENRVRELEESSAGLKRAVARANQMIARAGEMDSGARPASSPARPAEVEPTVVSGPPTEIEIVASTFRSFVAIAKFHAAVKSLPDVLGVKPARFANGALHLIVTCRGHRPLLEALADLPSFALHRESSTPARIELVLLADGQAIPSPAERRVDVMPSPVARVPSPPGRYAPLQLAPSVDGNGQMGLG